MSIIPFDCMESIPHQLLNVKLIDLTEDIIDSQGYHSV